jgi:FkbM family methyltransferase
MEEAHYKQIEAIKKLVSPKTIFADIGACRGDILKHLCNDCLRGYAFEPDPSNFSYLSKNFENKNVVIVNSAVSDVKMKIPFYVSESYVGNILGHDMDYRPFTKHIEIECTTLDDYFCDKDVDFIKMDVEGAEWKVFNGAKNILHEKNIVFQVEFHLDEDWHNRDMLYDIGYDIYTLDLQKISRDSKRIYQGIVAKDLI